MFKVSSILILVYSLVLTEVADASENPLHPILSADGWEESVFEDKRPNNLPFVVWVVFK